MRPMEVKCPKCGRMVRNTWRAWIRHNLEHKEESK